MAIITGLYGNPNYDKQSENDQESPRHESIRDIDRNIDKAIARLYEPDRSWADDPVDVDLSTIPLFGGVRMADTSHLSEAEIAALEERAAIESNLRLVD